MPRPKSLLKRIEVDVALKSHNCQHNRNHRIQRGDKRLKVRKDRSWEHYCIECALESIERDIVALKRIASEVQFEEK